MRKGVFIPDITVEMFRNATLEAVEGLLVSGTMEDIEIPDLPHGEWIPCSERLPSYSERIVLATVVRRDKTWNNDPYHRLVEYSNGKWYPVPQSINLVPCRMATIEQSDGGQAEVIAWMPLPAPYKKEGEQ